jgi:hypothetical protein
MEVEKVRPRIAHPEAHMSIITNQGLPLLSLFGPAFTAAATFVRAKLLGVAAILTNGRRTVANLLRTVTDLTEGDSSRPGFRKLHGLI